MKKWLNLIVVITLLVLCIFGSCREDFEFTPTTGGLEFSRDTVFLDTIFTNIGSSTRTLKVYNRSNDNILIPEISLRNEADSKYRLNVDGMAGNRFENVSLLAKDSLFVFVETTFDIASTGENEFLHTDAIQFGATGDFQVVELVTLVRDATFLFPSSQSDGSTETLLLGLDGDGNEIRVEGFLLEDEELIFTKEKPYVIYGYAAVTDGKILTIEAGSRVHFHKDSGILVGTGGSLQVQGMLSTDRELLENEVVFEGDRLEPEFENVPGQWGTVWLAAGSTANSITHLTIKNATIGLLVDGDGLLENPTLTLSNSQLHNSLNVNLWARTARLEAQNSVFGNAGNSSLYCNLGGSYQVKHCTMANYWTSGFRNSPALRIDDNMGGASQDLVNALFSNCIIDGNRDLELRFSNEGTGAFNYQFLNCSIKFRDPRQDFLDNPLYDFQDPSRYQNVLINPSIFFLDTPKNDFQLTPDTEVLDLGDLDTALEIPMDILGISRTLTPDLGAYELNQP
ncbi:MAG: hypothetical protein AAF039_11245 [Bacteroidota bacterium]